MHDDRILAWALALPLFVLALPLGLLDELVRPDVTATAVALVALIPAALLLLARAASGAGGSSSATLLRTAYLALVTWTIAAGLRGELSDSFEAGRCALHLAACFVAFAGGLGLGTRPEGRRALGTVLVTVSALLTLTGLLLPAGDAYAGPLQNSGVTSAAALPGALCAAAWVASGPGAWRRGFGGLVLVSYGLFIGAAPVLAGSVAVGFALSLGLWACGGRRAGLASAALLVALAVGLGFAVGRLDQGFERRATGAADDGGSAVLTATGGGQVRLLIWGATLALVREHALRGVGLGQFAAAFPPYRDPREIDLSSGGHSKEQETEVQHAHSDPVQLAAETGLIGGLLFLAVLTLLGRAVWRSLRARPGDGEHPERSAVDGLALAALGLIAAAFLRTPWSSDIASALAGCALVGVFAARRPRADSAQAVSERRKPASFQRALAAVAGIAALLSVPSAVTYLRSERALTTSFARTLRHSPRALDSAEQALGERPDSPVALGHRARLAQAFHEEPAQIAARWDALLARRPHSVEGLMQRALWALRDTRAGGHPDRDTARALWERALELDPEHDKILRNLARLASEEGRSEDALALSQRVLIPIGPHRVGVDDDWIFDLGNEAALAGHTQLATELWGQSDEQLAELAPDPAWALHERAAQQGNARHAAALETYARVAWGREQAESANWPAAARSYRQASDASRRGRGRPAPGVELELAAALVLGQRPDEAREAFERSGALARDLLTLPAWAGDALFGAGLLPRP